MPKKKEHKPEFTFVVVKHFYAAIASIFEYYLLKGFKPS